MYINTHEHKHRYIHQTQNISDMSASFWSLCWHARLAFESVCLMGKNHAKPHEFFRQRWWRHARALHHYMPWRSPWIMTSCDLCEDRYQNSFRCNLASNLHVGSGLNLDCTLFIYLFFFALLLLFIFSSMYKLHFLKSYCSISRRWNHLFTSRFESCFE